MPQFEYLAVDLQGKRVKGKLTAAGEKQLVSLLRQQDLLLLDACEKAPGKEAVYKMKPKESAEFCQRIGTMLGAGVPMIRVMNLMLEQSLKPQLRSLYFNMIGLLQQGYALSDAMEQQGGTFPDIMVNMFRLGELSGTLATNALRMKDHFEKENKQKSKVRTAAIYPIFLLCVTLLVVLAVFVGILPQFFELFEGMELPAITVFMLGASRFMVDHVVVMLVGLAALILLLVKIFRLPQVRRQLDKNKVHLPYIGKLMKIIYTSRFSRTLSTLYASGVPILQALSVVQTVIGNRYVAAQFQGLTEGVQNGEPLSVVVSRVDGFDAKLSATILAGEESGQLERMLGFMADAYDEEANQAIERMLAVMEPLMIIFMALIIGLIAISIMIPITQVYNNIG